MNTTVAGSAGARHTISARLDSSAVRPSAIVVDGQLGDPAWRVAPVATDFVQQRPAPGKRSALKTEARVWIEEVTGVETVLNFVDDFFLPPDRRSSALPEPGTAKR